MTPEELLMQRALDQQRGVAPTSQRIAPGAAGPQYSAVQMSPNPLGPVSAPASRITVPNPPQALPQAWVQQPNQMPLAGQRAPTPSPTPDIRARIANTPLPTSGLPVAPTAAAAPVLPTQPAAAVTASAPSYAQTGVNPGVTLPKGVTPAGALASSPGAQAAQAAAGAAGGPAGAAAGGGTGSAPPAGTTQTAGRQIGEAAARFNQKSMLGKGAAVGNAALTGMGYVSALNNARQGWDMARAGNPLPVQLEGVGRAVLGASAAIPAISVPAARANLALEVADSTGATQGVRNLFGVGDKYQQYAGTQAAAAQPANVNVAAAQGPNSVPQLGPDGKLAANPVALPATSAPAAPAGPSAQDIMADPGFVQFASKQPAYFGELPPDAKIRAYSDHLLAQSSPVVGGRGGALGKNVEPTGPANRVGAPVQLAGAVPAGGTGIISSYAQQKAGGRMPVPGEVLATQGQGISSPVPGAGTANAPPGGYDPRYGEYNPYPGQRISVIEGFRGSGAWTPDGRQVITQAPRAYQEEYNPRTGVFEAIAPQRPIEAGATGVDMMNRLETAAAQGNVDKEAANTISGFGKDIEAQKTSRENNAATNAAIMSNATTNAGAQIQSAEIQAATSRDNNANTVEANRITNRYQPIKTAEPILGANGEPAIGADGMPQVKVVERIFDRQEGRYVESRPAAKASTTNIEVPRAKYEKFVKEQVAKGRTMQQIEGYARQQGWKVTD